MADLGDIGKGSYSEVFGALRTPPGPIFKEAVNETAWAWPWYSANSGFREITFPITGEFSVLSHHRYVLSAGGVNEPGVIYDLQDGLYQIIFKDKQVWDMEVIAGEASFTTYGKPLPGNGYLSGEFPGGITAVDAVPTSATVRILYRPTSGTPGDGVLVAETQSAPDGTWRVDGLNPALRYDVVGRKAGLKDVIMSNVQPKVD